MPAGSGLVCQPFEDGETVQSRHLHVEEDQIGMMFLDEIDGFDSIGSLGNYVHPANGFEQILELFAG